MAMLATAILCFISVSIIAGGIIVNQSPHGGAVAVSAAWQLLEHPRGYMYVVDIVVSNAGPDEVEVSSVSVYIGNNRQELSGVPRVLRPGEAWVLTASFSVQRQQQSESPIVEVSYCTKSVCRNSYAMAKTKL